jgi:hypothetical protein
LENGADRKTTLGFLGSPPKMDHGLEINSLGLRLLAFAAL